MSLCTLPRLLVLLAPFRGADTPVCPSQADPAGYGGPPGTRITGETPAAGPSVVSRGDDHEVLKVRGSPLHLVSLPLFPVPYRSPIEEE